MKNAYLHGIALWASRDRRCSGRKGGGNGGSGSGSNDGEGAALSLHRDRPLTPTNLPAYPLKYDDWRTLAARLLCTTPSQSTTAARAIALSAV